MRNLLKSAALAGLWLLGLGLTGCSSPNVNPPVPKAHTGYVDFYTDEDLGLSWEIKRAEAQSGELRTVFSELTPVPGNTLRLAALPGSYRFQLWVMNLFTEGPQSVQVQVEEGKITPVHVTLTAAGATFVKQKDYSFRGSSKGYARGTKITTEPGQNFRLNLEAAAPEPYQPKEQRSYWSTSKN